MMMLTLKIKRNLQGTPIYFWNDWKDIETLNLSKSQIETLEKNIKKDKVTSSQLWHEEQWIWLINYPSDYKETAWKLDELYRKEGAKVFVQMSQASIETVYLHAYEEKPSYAQAFAQGFLLRAYQFLKYKTEAKNLAHTLKEMFFSPNTILPTQLKQLDVTIRAVYEARDLVNEPLSFLSAEQLSEEIKRVGKESGFKVSVFGKGKIEQLKMGGIIGVNKGSTAPPTFNIMEYHPIEAKNKKPIVLVGKGVVYDTGGVSLKPTLNSMDRMKSDMSGSAVVIGIMKAIAELSLPVHVIALIPATDNRPGPASIVPGDILTMYGGKTVEVLNTDAEGRLILADALVYAQKYQPSLVVDFATLTGAASAAIGDVAMVNMGTASEEMEKMSASGFAQFEKIVTYPLWEEYTALTQSDIADLKNVGGPKGGAITAGAFLKEFTDYPWVHFDIAGVSHTTSTKDYRLEGGTGYGIRMMLDYFIKQYS